MTGAMKKAAGGRGTNKAQLAAMQAMMSQMFGGSVPTLETYLQGKKLVKVRPSINVREACCVMAKGRQGLLVMEDEELIGIFTPQEVLKRVVSRGKSPDITAVSSVMITNPHSVSPKLTLLEALREMFEQKASYLAVEDDDGSVLGLVDVMELVCHTAGGEGGKGWRDFFKSAMTARGDDEGSEVASMNSEDKAPTSCTVTPYGKPVHVARDMDNFSDVFSIGLMTEAPPNGLGNISVSNLSAAGNHDTASLMASNMASKDFVFKIVDGDGHFHRIQCKSESIAVLRGDVAKLLEVTVNDIVMKYTDEDEDEVIITTDAALRAAIDYGRSCQKNSLKLSVTVEKDAPPTKPDSKDGVYAPPSLPTFSPSINKVPAASSKPTPTPTNLAACMDDETVSAAAAGGQQLEEGNTTKFIVVGGVVAALATIGFIFSRRNN
jgi:CBS domain-containing protein